MARESSTWHCGKHTITFDRPRIMGILNVTPDSFSDGGENFDQDAAIARGIAMLDEGADIIDVGGESTRPGFRPVSADEEARRVLPVVRALVAKGAIVSIDTRHVEVAKAAVRMGAAIVNDVTGFTDPKMVEFVANSNCGVVVMHAGELTEPVRAPHTAVTLDTSAAAYAAEREAERARAEAEGKPQPRGRLGRARGGKVLGEPRLKGGAIQQRLPFGDVPNGSAAAEAEQNKAAETDASVDAAPAAEQAAAVTPATEGAVAAAAPVETAVSTEKVPGAAEPGEDTIPTTDELAAIMQRANERRGATAAERVRQSRFTLPDSAPIMRRVMGFLSDQARSLMQAGVSRDRNCIDPGAGFGKSVNEDIVIQRETAKMVTLGYPLMCAVSRKRVVGAVSGVEKPADRDAATFGMCLGAIENGANIVRVHDVAGFAQFLNGYWAVAHPQPRRAFVALGSNLGRRLDNIRAARDLIAEIPLTCVFNCSRIYESEPAYVHRQDAFANAVIEIRTELAPLVLLDELMKIENRLGRNRTPSARPNGPRVIDCDLLWMEGETHGGDKLRLPHPKLGERDFVLVPLEDLVHDPARFFRYEGVKVLDPEERVGHVVGELGQL